MYWVFIKQWNTLQDTKSNRIDYFYERFKTNYILKKISLLIITLIAFSGASFSQNTFSLLITDLGGQATKTEEFSGFEVKVKINHHNFLRKMHQREPKYLQ